MCFKTNYRLIKKKKILRSKTNMKRYLFNLLHELILSCFLINVKHGLN